MGSCQCQVAFFCFSIAPADQIVYILVRFRNGKDLLGLSSFSVKNPQADLTWQKGAKRQMANLERFIEELMSFDDNVLPEATLNLVEPYLKKPSFDPETMERKTENKACGSLCKWVRGVCRYIIHIKNCQPKVQLLLEYKYNSLSLLAL